MHHTQKRNIKIRMGSALLFLYLPFLLMQFSYKFYVVANFYYFMSHQAYVIKSHSPVQHVEKKKAYQLSYYNPSHLTLDKRYHHKTSTDGNSFHAVSPVPVYVEVQHNFVTVTQALVTSSFTQTSPRAPPCA
jgi:hypothetical protein